MLSLNIPMQFKAAGDGAFSGHAAIFGTIDLGGDVIEPGAFKQIETNAEGRVVVLWQHRSGEPIGTALVTEEAKGLHFDGQLVLDDPLARAAHAHMRAGSVRGMSIGYDVLPGGAQMKGGVRTLNALKLWEISAVTFGMNPGALIESVKSPTDIRSFERLLREVGYSQKEATRIALHGFNTSAAIQPEHINQTDMLAVATALFNLHRTLKGT